MPFTELKELITIIGNKSIPDTTVFGQENIERGDARYLLFDGIRSDRFETQEQAATEIYKGKPGDNNFKLAKSRLKQLLIETVINFDVRNDKWMSVQQRAVHDAIRGVYEVRLLLTNGALHVARNQAERILSLAIKHHVTEAATQLARMLRSMSVYLGDKKKADEYATIHRNYNELLKAENRSEELIDEIVLLFSLTTDDLRDQTSTLEELGKEMTILYKERPTFLIITNYYRIHHLASHISGDHRRAAAYAVEAITYLEEHPELSSRSRIAEFANVAMNEYFTLGDVEQAEILAQRCFANYVPLSNQWYGFLSLYFVLIMHSGDYRKAMDIFRKAAVSALSVQPQSNQERWKVYAGYLLYLHQSSQVRFTKGEVDLLRKHFTREKFSFAFNYDLEVYAKDKTGMRISILILELLYAIEDGSLSDILALQEKLRLIYYRVLKPESYPRANAYFHLIQILMQEEFNTEETQKRSLEDLCVLDATLDQSSLKKKITAITNMEGLEILRYEVIWTLMIERIEVLKSKGKFS